MNDLAKYLFWGMLAIIFVSFPMAKTLTETFGPTSGGICIGVAVALVIVPLLWPKRKE